MIWKLRLGHTRITFTIAQVIDVVGVNSKLKDGNHILMWDFDNTPLDMVCGSLYQIQQEWELPTIFILLSSEPRNFIAYCFKRCTWQQCRTIIGETVGIDENFYKWGVFRRRFTLRVSEKNGFMPKYIGELGGKFTKDVELDEMVSWVRYETLNGHHNQMVHIVEVG